MQRFFASPGKNRGFFICGVFVLRRISAIFRTTIAPFSHSAIQPFSHSAIQPPERYRQLERRL
jgi:hypothetical protein